MLAYPNIEGAREIAGKRSVISIDGKRPRLKSGQGVVLMVSIPLMGHDDDDALLTRTVSLGRTAIMHTDILIIFVLSVIITATTLATSQSLEHVQSRYHNKANQS